MENKKEKRKRTRREGKEDRKGGDVGRWHEKEEDGIAENEENEREETGEKESEQDKKEEREMGKW